MESHSICQCLSRKQVTIATFCLLNLLFAYASAQNKAEIIQQARESVVWIHAFNMPYTIDEASYGTGTGYVVNDEGWILTNYHVINDINGLLIYAPSLETPLYGTVLWSDSTLDLAVIKAFNCNLKPLEFEKSESIRQGDETLVLGYPAKSYKNENLKVSWGIISSDPADSTIQTTAAINSGNSGGPAMNMKGKVIGTVFAKMVGLSIEGTGFIRNVKFNNSVLNKARSASTLKSGYFGTDNFEAYKKICDAAILGWKASQSEEFETKEKLNKQAQSLILQALDYDPNFCEAYYFLAAYYFIHSRNLCLNNQDAEAKTEFSNFKQAFITAETKSKALKPSLIFSKSSLNELGKELKDKEISCSRYREYRNDIFNAYLNKEKRMEEILEYINSGKTPELLKKSMYGYSGNYGSGGGNSNYNNTRQPSTFLTIGYFGKDRPVRLSFIYTTPFETYKSNLGFSLGNAGSPDGYYLFFKNQLSFQVMQDLGGEGFIYENQRYMIFSYNLGISAKFSKRWRFNPKPYITLGYNPMNYQIKYTDDQKTNTWHWKSGAFNFGADLDVWLNGSVGLSFSYEYTLFIDNVLPSLYSAEEQLNLKFTSIKIGLIF